MCYSCFPFLPYKRAKRVDDLVGEREREIDSVSAREMSKIDRVCVSERNKGRVFLCVCVRVRGV